MISWQHRDDGIVVLTLDDPEQSVNTMHTRFIAALAQTVDRLVLECGQITGVVITSAKPTFLAGADLKELTRSVPDAGRHGAGVGAAAFAVIESVKGQLRRLERLGRPVVAALNGTALAGGFELALACHHRIAVDDERARYGLPEVTLGLLPGAGGVVRVTRMLGLQEALTGVLLQGQRLRPAQALRLGLIDELVGSTQDLVPAAIAWAAGHPDAGNQPWDSPGYRIPGGAPTDPTLAAMLPAYPATLRKQLKGLHLPAAHAILCAAVEGAMVDVDTALRIESRWFASLVGTPIQRNLTGAFFHDLQQINKGGSRPASVGPTRVRQVGVLGAGMMGSGIGYACAKAGLTVTMLDLDQATAERGRAHAQRLLDAAVARGHSTVEHRDAVLGRITPVAEVTALAGCDAIIEAVVEDLSVKQDLFARVAAVVAPGTLLASNTSSLPITSLAQAVPDPAGFLGLHFFSPVEKMPLVEIIRGRQTSDETLARGFDLVRLLGKTPIVVHDSRGFFTSRVFGRYLLEGLAMLAEGVPAASIEQAALQVGYPVGPLAVTDEVSLTLCRRLGDEARKAGVRAPVHPGEAVIVTMLDEYGRAGKTAGGGFYEYPADGTATGGSSAGTATGGSSAGTATGGSSAGTAKRLWPGLVDAFHPVVPPAVPLTELQDRMLFAQVLDAVQCLDEGILSTVEDGNLGSILGIGFPAWTGGVLQFVDQYPGGVAGFVARASQLAQAYGERFAPSPALVARAERGEPVRPPIRPGAGGYAAAATGASSAG